MRLQKRKEEKEDMEVKIKSDIDEINLSLI